MDKFKNIIIGFGKAGKTLAKYLAQHDETVLLIERSKQMYGGTCINVGCLPSKNLILNGQRGLDFTTAVNKRGEMTRQLRDKTISNGARDGILSFRSRKPSRRFN